MPKVTWLIVLVAALAFAGGMAVSHSEPSTIARAATPLAAGGMLDAPPAMAATDPLPPGHPPIGGRSAAMDESPDSDAVLPAALVWKAPASWSPTVNSSAMRLATYRIPPAPGEVEATELSVVRAGGSPDANIDRWLGQFDDAGHDTRVTKVVHGLTVTEVDVRGTFTGGGMAAGGASSAAHPGWALLAAIVQTPGEPYFFKMTGPARSVLAARPAFEALVASVTPSSPSDSQSAGPRR